MRCDWEFRDDVLMVLVFGDAVSSSGERAEIIRGVD